MKNYIIRRRLNNIILDRDLQRTLFPLNLMQTVLFQPKYRIIRGFVIPNGYWSHMFCLLGFFCVIVINYCRLSVFDIFNDRSVSEFTFCVSIFESVFNVLCSFSMIIVNFVQRHNNVFLVLKIQQAFTVLKCKDGLKKYRISNWISVLTRLIFCTLVVSGEMLESNSNIFLIVNDIGLMYFDGNIIFCVQIIKILVHELKLWRKELDRFLATCSETDHKQLRKYLNDVSQQRVRLFRAYLNITEAYKLCGNIFYTQVVFLAIDLFTSPLFYLQKFIKINKLSDIHLDFFSFNGILSIFVFMSWDLKNYVLLICVCVACQQFELAVTDVDAACAVISCNDSGLADVRRLCKNVSRLSASARAGRWLHARGALAVDAALPLRLLALLATYTVVLLQFALN